MTRAVAWASYNEAQAARPVRPLCAQVLRFAGAGAGRTALDLGCGAGVETRAMAAAGWAVTAVDSDATFRARIADLLRTETVVGVVGDLRDVALPSAALVHSSLTLPFLAPAAFSAAWERIRTALLPGGWLGVDLFGPHDDWHDVPTMSFHDRTAAEALVAGLEHVRTQEREWDGPSHGGPDKHWHVVQLIARRGQ